MLGERAKDNRVSTRRDPLLYNNSPVPVQSYNQCMIFRFHSIPGTRGHDVCIRGYSAAVTRVILTSDATGVARWTHAAHTAACLLVLVVEVVQ